jgi:aromatic amino acid transport protein AroP|nr:amino acid permease [Noviherbaspirillum malthae]
MSSTGSSSLNRGLKNRHIQMIALGGAVGTGLFLGVAHTVRLAGPSVLLGYAIAGLIAFFIMRQLGEMVVEEPVAGSFSHFAHVYWGSFAGFISGWNYWVLYVLVSMAELTAVGVYMQFWWPGIPTWISALVFFILINGINMLHVRLFGEMEFWFSIIKVGAIVSMILFGSYLLATGEGGPQAAVTNLWQLGGFFPHGASGLIMAMSAIMFSFGGLELVGITAAEADEPGKTIPKATNQVIYRILIFYVGALAVLLSLYPWNRIAPDGSPFVLIFQALDNGWVATALNIIVLTAALSVYNSCVYCNSRMLLGLAMQGDAPAAMGRVNRRGVPVATLAVSGGATALCVLINYLMPGKALQMLMMLVVSALVINWAMITVTHLKFRRSMKRRSRATAFPSWGHPFTNYLCLAFMAGILVIMYLNPDTKVSVLLIPIWLTVLSVLYFFLRRPGASPSLAAEASSRSK